MVRAFSSVETLLRGLSKKKKKLEEGEARRWWPRWTARCASSKRRRRMVWGDVSGRKDPAETRCPIEARPGDRGRRGESGEGRRRGEATAERRKRSLPSSCSSPPPGTRVVPTTSGGAAKPRRAPRCHTDSDILARYPSQDLVHPFASCPAENLREESPPFRTTTDRNVSLLSLKRILPLVLEKRSPHRSNDPNLPLFFSIPLLLLRSLFLRATK